MQNKARLYSYYGGKKRLLENILALMPKEKFGTYVEPYFGSGTVFFALSPEQYEKAVVNDYDDGVAHFLKTLQGKDGDELFERLRNMRVDEVEFLNALYEEKHYFRNVDELEKAEMVYRLISQSFNASRRGFRKGLEQMQYQYTRKIVEGIPPAMEILRSGKVTIEMREGVQIIKERDSAQTFFILDPPYVDFTRKAPNVYKKEMNGFDHVLLCDVLQNIKGKAILCGYDNEIYNEMLNGWEKMSIPTAKPSANKRNAIAKEATEIMWYNFEKEK